MTPRTSFALLFAASLLAACGPARPQDPGAKTERPAAAAGQDPIGSDEHTTVPSEFARFVKQGDGGHLDTAVVTYRNKDGVEVVLYGAVHIADTAHYDDLQARFARCDALLYELVGPENYRPRPGQRSGGFVSFLQRAMKTGLELDFQLDAVDYSKQNFVHADMTPGEFQKHQEEKGESILGLMWQAMVKEMQRLREGGDVDPDMKALAEMDLVSAFRKGEGRHLLRMLFAQSLQDVERIAAGFGSGDEGSVLVEGRNEKCLEVLQREIKAGKQKLGIYYGAAHLPHMEKRLTEDLGFAKVRHEWIVAWDCQKRPDKKPEAAAPVETGVAAAIERAKQARIDKARFDLKVIADAVEIYLVRHGAEEPPTIETLTTPDERGKVWLEGDTVDPWGNRYELLEAERPVRFEVVSAGPDGKLGTADDLSSRDK